MEANVQARIDFTEKVMAGKYTRAQAEAELDRMEREFGDLAFLPGTVTRKPKPWTMKHLEELKNAAVCGAGSRAFHSYMAEVGEEVHRKLRIRKWIKTILAAFAGIAAVAAAAALLWWGVTHFRQVVTQFWRAVHWILRK